MPWGVCFSLGRTTHVSLRSKKPVVITHMPPKKRRRKDDESAPNPPSDAPAWIEEFDESEWDQLVPQLPAAPSSSPAPSLEDSFPIAALASSSRSPSAIQSFPQLCTTIDALVDEIYPDLPPVVIPSASEILTSHSMRLIPEQYILHICSPERKLLFRQYLASLPSHARHVELAFHGTRDTHLNSILGNGILLPGERNSAGRTVRHQNDTGYYGRGIYLSPDFSYSENYGGDGAVLFVSSLAGGCLWYDI